MEIVEKAEKLALNCAKKCGAVGRLNCWKRLGIFNGYKEIEEAAERFFDAIDKMAKEERMTGEYFLRNCKGPEKDKKTQKRKRNERIIKKP